MSYAALAAKTLIVGIPTTEVDATARRVVADLSVGGVILFRRNIVTPEQTHGLIASLRALRKTPLLLAVDQEGGRVQRLRTPLTEFPPMRAIGEAQPHIAKEVGAQLARELLAVGFDLDFAPVVDVDTNPDNPVIGDRSFGRTPEIVSKLAVALIEGMQSAGMMACAKHFPGHGDTLEDSHKDLPSLPHDLERLRRVEWPPFAATAKAKVATIMTAHVMFPALDPIWPATMSATCLAALRKEIGFEGAIISDDLEMKAIADRYELGAAAVQSIAAGCDSLLVCHTLSRIEASIEAIAKEAEKSVSFRARLSEAAARVDTLLARVPAHAATYKPAAAPSGELAAWMTARKQQAKLVDPTEVPAALGRA
jgi:beta-N-acetylhexosaminidase